MVVDDRARGEVEGEEPRVADPVVPVVDGPEALLPVDRRQSPTALRIQRGVRRLFSEMGCVTLPEFSLANGRRADVIALCNTGQDCTNALKQAMEFGLSRDGQKMAALGMFLTDVHGAGLAVAQNALFATADYWDMNAETREWSRSYLAAVGQMPTMLQSGTYGVALHYLRAVQASGSVEAGTVMAQMQNQPVDNIFIRNASLRGDGRVVRGMYLARVKTPEQSKAPWDYLELVREVRAEDAVRPASESMCPLLRKT